MNDQLPEWQPPELPDAPKGASSKARSKSATEPVAPSPVAPAQPSPNPDYTSINFAKPPTSAGTIVARFIGFSCLGIGMLFFLFACSFINGLTHNFSDYVAPTMDARVAKLTIQANDYRDAFLANKSLIPDLQAFQQVQGNYGELPCPDKYSSPDTCTLGWTEALSSRDDAKYCAEVITLAKKLGATHDSVPNAAQMDPLTSNSTNRCVTTLSTYPRSVGSSWYSPRYFLQGENANKTPFIIQLSLQQDSAVNLGAGTKSTNTDPTKLASETWKYSIITSTGFDTVNPISQIPDYTDGKIQAAAMLDTVAYYRSANPKIDPFNATFANTMLREYKAKFRFDGTVSAHSGADGTVHWVQFAAPDFKACISVGELVDISKPSESTGISMLQGGLPGGSVELGGLGTQVQSISSKSKFGDYVLGGCR